VETLLSFTDDVTIEDGLISIWWALNHFSG